MRRAFVLTACALSTATACGSPPPPREAAKPVPIVRAPEPERDPCEPVNGQPPAPLASAYSGVLARARCQPEVLKIMQSVSRALGVDCTYCHDAGDFSAMTPKKAIANWMAAALIPSLAKRGGGAITCADCHSEGGRGRAKILGAPRSRSLAVEWMTASLVERFDAASGGPLYCKTCHVENLGSPGFVTHVILTDHLPSRPAPVATP